MDILGTAIDISFVLVMLGVAFAFIRLILGPSLPDRVVALDMMTVSRGPSARVSNTTCPASGAKCPAMQFSSVDLPEPLSPTIPITSPG